MLSQRLLAASLPVFALLVATFLVGSLSSFRDSTEAQENPTPRWEYGILSVRPAPNDTDSWEFRGPREFDKRRLSARKLIDAIGSREPGSGVTAVLNALGSQGWELVQFANDETRPVNSPIGDQWVFRRLVVSKLRAR